MRKEGTLNLYLCQNIYDVSNRKSNTTGRLTLTGCILKHMIIRLISSHDYKVEQKMTALFLAISFALGNEENINDSVDFAGLLHSRTCLRFPLT